MDKYWETIRDKAAGNIHDITRCEVTCEDSLKKETECGIAWCRG